MTADPIATLNALGQSLWYDHIQRRLLENGELQALIERGQIRGVTSNPTIFYQAIARSSDYDSALLPLAWAGWDAERIFWQLAIEDVQEACDLFLPLYEETHGGDGYVSLEVSPYLAYDTEATVAQAQALWDRVARPNLMIKIPATRQGIPAIRRAIAAGINVNVTLIFSLERYTEVMFAYLDGLEDRLAADKSIDHVASVASFFVSRLDTKVDALLPPDSPLRGRVAIAKAKLAYEAFTAVFTTRRWENLKLHGARVQRPLWASTSTKNPAYPDTLYVDNLIGPETVNTVPPATLEAFRDHGVAELTLTRDLDQARQVIAQLEALGISLDEVTRQLEEEGVKAFADSFAQLLNAIEERRRAAVTSLGPLAGAVAQGMASLEAESFVPRLWQRDASLWTSDPTEQREVVNRLGWLDYPQKAWERLPYYRSLAEEARRRGIDRVLVLGMGGSSLAAETYFTLLSATSQPALHLAVLDTTDPLQVKQAALDFPPEKSLYIVASKSGGTAEVMATFEYFWSLSNRHRDRFLVITDPGTDLERQALERKVGHIVHADPQVGGRYSAFIEFGLVPAALVGMDLEQLLRRAGWMKRQCGPSLPAARNPGVALGVILAEAARNGRDKLTLVADPALEAFTAWIEQLVAESSGKQGKGILPVPLEPLASPESYGSDRLFVYLRQQGLLDEPLSALQQAGHPVVVFSLSSMYDVGAEMLRWMIATATACHLLGVNAFDQPDVQESKRRTLEKIAVYRSTGRLPDLDLIPPDQALPALRAFLAEVQPGDFIALLAYLPRTAEINQALQKLRQALRGQTRLAVTVGFGPRFQHSTGQYHKGGPNRGHFIQLVYECNPAQDVLIPNQELTFHTLLRAQALGDYEALQAAGRRVIRLRLPSAAWLGWLVEQIAQ